MRPAQLDRAGKESPKTHGPRHWTHRTPERITWRGMKNKSAKLHQDQVYRILRCAGTMPDRALAELFRVSRSTIRSIRTRKTWRHL